jgi:hypothetical protein
MAIWGIRKAMPDPLQGDPGFVLDDAARARDVYWEDVCLRALVLLRAKGINYEMGRAGQAAEAVAQARRESEVRRHALELRAQHGQHLRLVYSRDWINGGEK